MSQDNIELLASLNRLPWHHEIEFGDGIRSPGKSKHKDLVAQAEVVFRHDMRGRTVLDIGCWDGFYSFEAKKRGAARVLATDHFAWSDQCWGNRESFELARRLLKLDVEVRDIDLPEISNETVGIFDVVLFLGVFYHLRHPFAALERIAGVCRETLIVETHLGALDVEYPAMIFYPGSELANDHTNWWGPNVECVSAMLRDLGFGVEYFPNPAHAQRGIFVGRRLSPAAPKVG